jgi:hypothetical protein
MSTRLFISCLLNDILSSRGVTNIVLCVLILGHSSCKSSKKEAEVEAGVPQAESQVKVEEKAPEKKPDATPPLTPSRLEQVSKMGVLVQIPDKPLQQGVLIEGTMGNSSNRNYLVICEASPDCKSIGVACRGNSGIEKAFAKRISTLPSGLSLFGFSSKSSLAINRPIDPIAGETFHAFQLKGEGTVPTEEVAALTSELETLRNKFSEIQLKRSPGMMQTPEMMQRRTDPRQRMYERQQERAALETEFRALLDRQSEINARLKIPITSITAVEVAADTTRETLETAGNKLDNTLLATTTGSLRAIRFNGKWVDIKDILASGADLESVKLNLSGSQQNANLSCELKFTIPSAEYSYSMVAATTFELESQGSGSLEERLAAVKPVSFRGGSGQLSAQQQMEWNGRKTKLWVKIFNDKKPEKPILDEVISLDYTDNFSARWAKPPSPLIFIPPSEPNMPEGLVKEQQSLNAKGEIRDLVAAGDGSVMMVQTNQAPYWAPLDLKTGQWMSVPWKATADTLAASQAGKIYLIDRKTKILEVWGLASNKRESIHLLSLQGSITAVTAPLTDSTRPLMVTTEKNGYFLDPVKFEVIPSNLNLAYFFDIEDGKRRGITPMNPASICIRASGDGSMYSFSGISGSVNQTSRSNLILTVDRSAMVVNSNSDNQLLASRGRNLTRGFPDHGGSELIVTPSSSNGRFPGPSGEIRFADGKERNEFAVMKNPPALPSRSGRGKDELCVDRGVYLDSSVGLMLLPDGEALHLVRLNLPEQKKQLPDFLFVGESLEIPLPVGTGHKLIADGGGKSEIGSTSIRWYPPVKDDDRQFSLKLEWTGELGSQISQDYQIRVFEPIRGPEVLAPGGSKSVPLRLKGILNDVTSGIVGFAGSGTVVLTNESDSLCAWNLATSELLLRVKEKSRDRFIGDADRIYILEREGNLTTYDIQSGEEIGKADLGKKIESIATGISSRNSLLAVERDGGQSFLLQIPRDTMKPLIVDLSKDLSSRLFIPQMVSNASGSAVWSRGVGIFRDNRAITLSYYGNEVSDGVPDASGQFIVGRDEIIDIASKPPKSIKISNLPGTLENANSKLDESGRYLLISGYKDEPREHTVSLRDIREPSKELLKIRCPPNSDGNMPWFISNTNTLVQFSRIDGNAKAFIYDFNLTELTKQLSR